MQKIKIVVLGSNGWYANQNGNTSCILLESQDYYIVFDMGDGFHKIGNYIKDDKKPIYIFLSHFHLDHIYGFHILNKFRFQQPIKIFGQKGTISILNNIVRKPYMMPLKNLKLNISIIELEEGTHQIPFSVECRYLLHADPCYGFKIKIDNKTISYCTDTGICDNLFLIAQNSDILITECSHRIGETSKSWPHLNPQNAAETANKSKSKMLLLMHFIDMCYPTLKERNLAKKEAQKTFPNTIASYDGLIINI